MKQAIIGKILQNKKIRMTAGVLLAVGIAAGIYGAASANRITENQSRALTLEQIEKLYAKGYGLADIKEAERVWKKTGRKVDRLLKEKGKTSDLVNEMADAEPASTPAPIDMDLLAEANAQMGIQEETDHTQGFDEQANSGQTAAGNDAEANGGNRRRRKSLDIEKDRGTDIRQVDRNAKGENGKSWREIEEKLGVYEELPDEKAGVTEDIRKQLTEKGYTQAEVRMITDMLELFDLDVYDLDELLPENVDMPELVKRMQIKMMTRKYEKGEVKAEQLQEAIQGTVMTHAKNTETEQTEINPAS